MTGNWAVGVTFILFCTAVLATIVLGVLMTLAFHRQPEAYRRAFWQNRLFSLDFLRTTTSRPEFGILVTCFALVALLFAWVLTAVLVGWLKPVARGG